MSESTAGSHRRIRSVAVGLALLLLALISYFWFPGHTILQSDTQVYIPILQHIEDPSLLAKDIMAVRPHVTYTLYDELTLGLRDLTGLSFEQLLMAQHFVYRGLGIVGLYLIGTGIGLGIVPGLVLAALASLGSAVLGPAVLVVEYEPVPRAFALPFLLLSMGALAHGRHMWASGAATMGFALHPPTVLAYCAVLVCALGWRRRWPSIGVLLIAPALFLLTMAWEPPAPERPALFARIDPALEQLQRTRAPYNWVSLWIGVWWKHYALLTVALALGFVRIWKVLPFKLRIILIALPVIGWISIPASYYGLEVMKWALIPQYQPARHLLFVTLFAILCCSLAALLAASGKRYIEATLFALVPLLAAQETNLVSTSLMHFALAAGVAVLLAFGIARKRTAFAAAILPFLLIPTVGGVQNYPDLHSEELNQLSEWARAETPRDAMFQFADAGRGLAPGIFRARAQRALYADWKGGGQINFLPSFAEIWARRWEVVSTPKPLRVYRNLGIDYVVYSAAKAPYGVQPVYSNAGWFVYHIQQPDYTASITWPKTR